MEASFIILPDRREHPFRNMEEDLLLLHRNPFPGSVIFRHYAWAFPCWTCGYSQKFAFVKERTGGTAETIFRRPTGGGIVPHANDWTFTLVVGPEHPAFQKPPREFYHLVHSSIVDVLKSFRTGVVLHACRDDSCGSAPAEECFRSPVLSDVLHAKSGEKIAGAAIKKNRGGVLLQGSIQKSRLPGLKWSNFKTLFSQDLSRVFGAESTETEWPFSTRDTHPPYGERIHHAGWLQG